VRARVPARRESVLEANGVFLVLDQGGLWASGTIPRPRDEDAIPPIAGSRCVPDLVRNGAKRRHALRG
jgi:hypothetical protein